MSWLTSTVGHLSESSFLMHPLSITTLNVGNTAAIGKLKSPHAFGIAVAERQRLFNCSPMRISCKTYLLVHFILEFLGIGGCSAQTDLLFWQSGPEKFSGHWHLPAERQIPLFSHGGMQIAWHGGTWVNSELLIIQPLFEQNISSLFTPGRKV